MFFLFLKSDYCRYYLLTLQLQKILNDRPIKLSKCIYDNIHVWGIIVFVQFSLIIIRPNVEVDTCEKQQWQHQTYNIDIESIRILVRLSFLDTLKIGKLCFVGQDVIYDFGHMADIARHPLNKVFD